MNRAGLKGVWKRLSQKDYIKLGKDYWDDPHDMGKTILVEDSEERSIPQPREQKRKKKKGVRGPSMTWMIS